MQSAVRSPGDGAIARLGVLEDAPGGPAEGLGFPGEVETVDRVDLGGFVRLDHRLAMHGAEDGSGHHADRIRVPARIDPRLDRPPEVAAGHDGKAQRERQFLDREEA